MFEARQRMMASASAADFAATLERELSGTRYNKWFPAVLRDVISGGPSASHMDKIRVICSGKQVRQPFFFFFWRGHDILVCTLVVTCREMGSQGG